jgi:phosphoglycolate phosphatase
MSPLSRIPHDRPRLAIFDFDGTLADSFEFVVATFNEIAAKLHFDAIAPEDLEMLRGMSPRRAMAHQRMPMWRLPQATREMRRRVAEHIDEIPVFEGVSEMLATLERSGIAIAVVTSNSRENVERILGPENAARIRYFGCGGSMFGKRPKFLKVLRESGVAADEAISIGDEIRDAEASRAAGLRFGAVSWGYAKIAALEPHADVVFASIAEMTEWICGTRATDS